MITAPLQLEHPIFVHRMAEGAGLSADDTHFRYVDEYRSAKLVRSAAQPLEAHAGKAAPNEHQAATRATTFIACALLAIVAAAVAVFFIR